MARSHSKAEIAMGLFLAACLAGGAWALARYAKIETFWKKRQEIFVLFENVGSLTQDAPVRYNGIEKGRVKSLRPLHIDAAILDGRFPVLRLKDLDNLPIRSSAEKHRLSELPPERFDKECRAALVNTTMIELCLEVLDEDDPIQYHRNDAIRIDATIFGDAAVEIVSGSDESGNQLAKPRDYVIGNSGDFISNLSTSMNSMKKILGNVTEVVGAEERASFGHAQDRYGPVTAKVNNLTKTAAERMARTTTKYNNLAQTAKERLNRTAKALEGIVPAAETMTKTVQAALKDIQGKTDEVKSDANEATAEISKEIVDVRDAVKTPYNLLRDALSSSHAGMLKAKINVEKAPARIDSTLDALGSMQSQSASDFERAAEAGKKVVFNLKIAAFVAKENKDLMLGNRDAGEYVAQSALDIRRKLAMASRRMSNAGADLLEAIGSIQNDPAIELIVDPVVARAENAVKQMQAIRAPLDSALMTMEETMYPPWNLRKRAAWRGDGVVRWPEGGR